MGLTTMRIWIEDIAILLHKTCKLATIMRDMYISTCRNSKGQVTSALFALEGMPPRACAVYIVQGYTDAGKPNGFLNLMGDGAETNNTNRPHAAWFTLEDLANYIDANGIGKLEATYVPTNSKDDRL